MKTTMFVCRRHEGWVDELIIANALLPYDGAEIINECSIQPRISSTSRCKRIGTGCRITVKPEYYEIARTLNKAALACIVVEDDLRRKV